MALAAALALLLPSALTVPQSGPTTLAEFAPVPGQGQGKSDVSDLGQASSGGLGFGSGSRAGGSFSEPTNLGGPKQTKAQLKKCVGNPPRQTEDPWSPPCVAFFDGDNGGASGKGVTRDEVIAVLHSAKPSDRPNPVDCNQSPSSGDINVELACKAYMRFFNHRYQTYARSVHLYSTRDGQMNADSRTAETATVDEKYRPFAIVTSEFAPVVYGEAVRRKILNVTYPTSARSVYTSNAPLLWGFLPDSEDEGALIASYVCRKLAGRTAKYSGNPGDVLKIRKFALAWQATQSHMKVVKRALLEGCGVDAYDIENFGRATVTTLKEQGVTSVIPITTSGLLLSWTIQADADQWRPEWIVPGSLTAAGADHAETAGGFSQSQWRNAFGITFDRRRDAPHEQPWYQAFKETCPECPEPSAVEAYQGVSEIYDNLLMLFHGIQAAGPRLTPASFDKGMHAIPARSSVSPYAPAAYFSPGNYTYLKDAMGIWWDPLATAAGSTTPGCYKLPYDGKRMRIGEWPEGDDDIKKEGPCQGLRS